MVEVPEDVCHNSGIVYVPAYTDDPPPEPEGLILSAGDGDFYEDNYYDVRTYDATWPSFGMLNSLGGLTVGLDIMNMDLAAQISRVEIISVNGNIDQKIVLSSPDILDFLGQPIHIYTIVIAAKHQIAPQYDVFVYDLENNLIQFMDFDGSPLDRWSIFTIMDQVNPPLMKLRKAVLTRNKGIRVKFTAPFDARDGELRIRLIDENDVFVHQYRVKGDPTHPQHLDGLAKDDAGHYFFVKKDGTVVLDKIKVFIPMEYAGFKARIEYRIYDGNSLRGITHFTLPAPEPVVEEEPEVTVVECPDESGLVSVVDGVCTCPDTYNYVDGIGCQ
jgi:hypothetical protein